MNKFITITLLASIAFVNAEVEPITIVRQLPLEESPDATTTTENSAPHRPYYFSYSAGRFPGHLDRSHTELSDGSGNVKGSFSYVDPRFKLRTVDYTVDKNGFHPILNEEAHTNADTPVVARAKENHYKQYEKIAQQHAKGAENISPTDTDAVAKVKALHDQLYKQIVAEHQRIAAEREAILATANPNEIEEIQKQTNF